MVRKAVSPAQRTPNETNLASVSARKTGPETLERYSCNAMLSAAIINAVVPDLPNASLATITLTAMLRENVPALQVGLEIAAMNTMGSVTESVIHASDRRRITVLVALAMLNSMLIICACAKSGGRELVARSSEGAVIRYATAAKVQARQIVYTV